MYRLIYSIQKEMNIPFHSGGIAQRIRGKKYIVWQIVSDVPGATINHSSDISKVRIQFDIYSDDEEEIFAISNQLEKETRGKGLVLLRNGPFFNVDTKNYRRTIDISFLKGNSNEPA